MPSIVFIIRIDWPNGAVDFDQATGNTRRTALAALNSLQYQYEKDGAKTTLVREVERDDS